MQEPSLGWLIAPVSPDDFFQTHWEKRPLVVKRDQPHYYGSLLSFGDVDRVLTTLDRRYPDVCLKQANSAGIPPGEYTSEGGKLDAAKLYQLFERGATVTMSFLDTVLPALTVFCRGLEREFSHPFQTNVYMTPPHAQGARPHYDTHDVFVMQVAGNKHWTLFGTPVESPLRTQDFDRSTHELGTPAMEFELEPGDLAYIPRGVAHEARSSDRVSLHITTGILAYTWADLLLEFLASATLENPALRKALPAGFARSGFDKSQALQTFRGLWRQAGEGESGFDPALELFADRFLRGCPPVLEGQLSQLLQLDSLTVGSAVGMRPTAVFRLRTEEDGKASIDVYGRTISFPAHASEAVQFALSRPQFAVEDLPGNLDGAGKLTLVRRLIREGLLTKSGGGS